MNFQRIKPPPPDPMLGFYKAQKSAKAVGVSVDSSVSANFKSVIFRACIPEVDRNKALAEVSMSHEEFRELQRDDKQMAEVFERLVADARAEQSERLIGLDLFG